jgi:hypothetical protein
MPLTSPPHIDWRTGGAFSWNFTVSKPIQMGTRQCYMIKNNDKTRYQWLMIQTPWMCMPYYPIYDDRGNASIDLCVWKKADIGFYDALDVFHSRVKAVVNIPESDIYSYISPLRDADGFYPKRLKLRGVTWKDVPAFDGDCSPIDTSKIRIEEPVRCLLALRYVWKNDTMYGLKYQLCQIQLMTPVFTKSCLIIQDNDQLKPKPESKYDAMKKAGIPIIAIRHKMKMDGITNENIEAWANDGQNTSIITSVMHPLHPLPSLPSLVSKSKTKTMTGNIGGLKITLDALQCSKAKLKNIIDQPINTVKSLKPLFQAPSLTDLLRAKSSLRRVSTVHI